MKEQLSVALGLPKERIRLNPVAIGGDYGGKGSPMDIPLAYSLALRTGRPVRMVMDYTEEFTAGNPRHAAIIQLKTGVKRDGTMVAHQARVLFDSGAYGGFKPVPTVNLGGAALRPAQVGAYPAGASAYGVEQLMGDVWAWITRWKPRKSCALAVRSHPSNSARSWSASSSCQSSQCGD